MVHYSKKDWWLVAMILAAVLIQLGGGALFILIGGHNTELGRSLLIAGCVTGVTVLVLTYPLYYKITNSELVVRCGILINQSVPLASIDEVRPDRNSASAPAWSLDRVRINYRKVGGPGSISISPEDKTAFMRDLANTDPGLKMKGNGLVRGAA